MLTGQVVTFTSGSPTSCGSVTRIPHSAPSHPIISTYQTKDSMQLTAKHGDMVVDFYPVKYADGSISERLMFKSVTFMKQTQSKSYINIESFQKEVDSRVEGYNYEVTALHTTPQLFNSALIQTRW